MFSDGRMYEETEVTFKDKIQLLRNLGITEPEMRRLLADWHAYGFARKMKKALRLDAWYTMIEFGYWVE